MKYLKMFENFNDMQKFAKAANEFSKKSSRKSINNDLISEVENIIHILQDEGHIVEIRKDIKNYLWISVEVFNPIISKIRDNLFKGSHYIDSDLEADSYALDKIMELEEFEEFYERLEEIGKGFQIDVLYTNQQVIFYFK